MLNIPPALLDQLDQAIRRDDAVSLEAALGESNLAEGEPSSQSILLNLLQRAISTRAKNSIDFLLNHVQSLDEPDDINGRNCIHRLVIHMGRNYSAAAADQEASSYPFPRGSHYAAQYLTPAASPLAAPRLSALKESSLAQADGGPAEILVYLLEHVRDKQRDSTGARDAFGRMPLHYAAQFGFVDVCRLLIAKMREWAQFSIDDGIDSLEWQDKDGFAPVHLSVIGGHPLTTKALLEGGDEQDSDNHKGPIQGNISSSSAVLALATKHNYYQIVKMLVDAGVDINWQDKTGESALHVAARFGHSECAEILIQGTDEQKADLHLAEKSFAWTPLHIAAVDGHLAVAQLLVDAGADASKVDSSGWTAKEHAALRAHWPIARLLLERSPVEIFPTAAGPGNGGPRRDTTPPETTSLGDRRSNGAASRAAESQPQPQPVRTYGHRYLKDETLVLVSLGSMDMRKATEAVMLERVPLAKAHHTQLDTALSIVVSASGAQGEPTVMDLPVHENISTEPIVFTTHDATKVKLLFDLVPTYSGSDGNKIGRGVALLSHVRPSIGAKRMNLQGDVCVPILGADFEVIGTVHFNFLVITPFAHANMEVTSAQTYWRKMSSTMVIGHRGLGKNMTSNRSLQLGENTVPSFIAAANLGASYVEFDVQLTKDHIPVIYHDFFVSETGIDAPVHTLTLEQFLHINPDLSRARSAAGRGHDDGHGYDGDSHHPSGYLSLGEPHSSGSGPMQPNGRHQAERGRRIRSHSIDHVAPDDHQKALEERMKHTRDFKIKGFKANSRGHFIQAPFATLAELFRKLPANVGFNIEMKYPMLHESEEHGMDAYAVELNSFCDTVLDTVYDQSGDRNIIFSSFNPDICLCLSFKQPNFPILFLTDAGCSSVGDVRASSLQEAIRFARRWNLLGVVSVSEPFVNSPRLVRVVKESGLVCVSYGAQNNDPALVEVGCQAPTWKLCAGREPYCC